MITDTFILNSVGLLQPYYQPARTHWDVALQANKILYIYNAPIIYTCTLSVCV